MVPGIDRTAVLVQEIAASADEQTNGAGRISRAMLWFDNVTQQNAATSEELAAASTVV